MVIPLDHSLTGGGGGRSDRRRFANRGADFGGRIIGQQSILLEFVLEGAAADAEGLGGGDTIAGDMP
jgi:hypothetical protein